MIKLPWELASDTMKRETERHTHSSAMICSRSIHPPSEETLHTQPATTKSMFTLFSALNGDLCTAEREEKSYDVNPHSNADKRAKNCNLTCREHSISISIRASQTCGT